MNTKFFGEKIQCNSFEYGIMIVHCRNSHILVYFFIYTAFTRRINANNKIEIKFSEFFFFPLFLLDQLQKPLQIVHFIAARFRRRSSLYTDPLNTLNSFLTWPKFGTTSSSHSGSMSVTFRIYVFPVETSSVNSMNLARGLPLRTLDG